MTPKSLKKALKDRHAAGILRPLYVEGSPGLGKTQIIEQCAAELGIDCRVLHAPLMQPEDYGFPVISDARDTVNFIVPQYKFPIDAESLKNGGILLFDDAGQCEGFSQKIIANIVEAREIHGNKILPNWSIVATGNREKDRAGSIRLLSHLANRVTRVQLDVSLDDWTQWALANDVKSEVIAFIRFRPELLNNFDPKNDVNATPRAWVKGVSMALGVVDSEVEFEIFRGDVGEGAASEFLAFLKIYRNLPDPDAILLNPDKMPVPNDPATLYALCGALAHRTTPVNFDRVMAYIARIPSEFGVLFVRDALARCPELAKSKSFIAWASSEGARVLT